MAAAPKHKIVVVEDEGLIAADLESRLKAAGYAVPGTADCASQALQLVRETTPDLVLMDIRIKGSADGIQVADQLRREFDVPVVYLTAYEDRAILERASRTQAFGYIKKPIASSSLQGSIEMAIAKHRHERDLRAQRDWLAASFAAVPHAVLVTDGSGRVGYLNSLAEELTGWNTEQALGHPVRELLRLVYRESGKPVEDFVPVAMLQGETIPFPTGVWLKGAEGRSYAIEGSVAPRWRDGRIEGAVIALTDTTLCQFEEEQARQERKQEALLRMTEGMMRELPDMSALAEDSVRLLDELPSDSRLRENAEAIERAAMDAFAVTYRIRRFLEPPDVQPGRVVVNEMLARLEDAWKQIQPDLILAIDANPMPVQADEWQLTRALVSILLHARRQMLAGSEVAMDASGGVYEQMSHSVRIRVTYTTAEEDAASIERIFEPCWSGDSNDLALAYRLIKKMGGLLVARLERRDRVTFEIYLCRAEAAAAGVPIPESQKPAALLIEPNPEVRRVLHLHLERHGYRLLEAADCQEGLLLSNLYQAPIPLIIANPDQDDPARSALAERLKAIRPATRVRVLAGYYEACRAAAGGSIESIGTRHLTKWDLLAWVQDAFASASIEDAAL
jgi:PAS domain S-box-containing protein